MGETLSGIAAKEAQGALIVLTSKGTLVQVVCGGNVWTRDEVD